MNELVDRAVLNNATWCDIVCKTHHNPGQFLEYMWINPNKVPRFYPNAILTKRFPKTATKKVIDTFSQIPLETFAIKDSFNELSLPEFKYKTLFKADWISYSDSATDSPAVTENWVLIKNEQELKKWEEAWSDQPVEQRTFPEKILDEKDVFFLAKYHEGKIVSGAIVNLSDQVAGLSNLFSHDSKGNVWSECTSFIKQNISELPIVGYERDEALVLACEAGYKKIGKLKVLLKQSSI